MSRSDREEREQAARRARRLAERAEQRARRQTEQARRAADRAEKLAERARRGSSRRDAASNPEDSFEDRVDRFAEKWEKKAEAFFEDKFSSSGADEDLYGTGTGDVDLDDDSDSSVSGTRRRRQRAEQAAKADERRRRRHRRAARRRRHAGRTFSSRFRSGRGLYRDKQNGKICGVCAGLADYLDLDTWQVRAVAVFGLVFLPSVAVPTYFILYFVMDDKPYYRRVTDQYDDAEDEAHHMSGEPSDGQSDNRGDGRPAAPEMSNAEAFRTAKQKFADIEDRLRGIESHVTSSRFELQRELRKISGDDG